VQGKPTTMAFQLNNDGTLRWGMGGSKKGEGQWSVSDNQMTLQLSIGGAPMPTWNLKLQQTDNNHFTATDQNGEVQHWTRQ
jgi:hypothetical protein